MSLTHLKGLPAGALKLGQDHTQTRNPNRSYQLVLSLRALIENALMAMDAQAIRLLLKEQFKAFTYQITVLKKEVQTSNASTWMRVTDVSEFLLILFYISKLKLALQWKLLVSKLTTLGEAFSLARNGAIFIDRKIQRSLGAEEHPRCYQAKGLKVEEKLVHLMMVVKFEVLIEKKRMCSLGLMRFNLWMEFLMVDLEELEMNKLL
ncbi:hypothetical protein Tco_0233273 [Tanacetum coccineum]